MSKFINVGVDPRIKTKKELKARIAAGEEVRFYATSPFDTWAGPADELDENTTLQVCGPDPYNNRKWYASVTRKKGEVKVS